MCEFEPDQGDDIQLNSRTFLWPAELQIVLDLSAKRLSVIRENLEIALKYACMHRHTHTHTLTHHEDQLFTGKCSRWRPYTRFIMLESLSKYRLHCRRHIVF